MSEKPEACYLEYGFCNYNIAFDIFPLGAAPSTSFRLSPQSPEEISPEELTKMSRDLMLEIADSCVKRGAKYIGHIKSYLKSDEGEIFADTLGVKRTTNVKSTVFKPLKSARLVVNSIVQGIDKTQVKEATVESIYRVIKNYGFNIEVEEERQYYDDFG